MRVSRHFLIVCLGVFIVSACSSSNLEPIRTAASVDLNRFMGDWYVVGNIPTPIETEAYNAVESYALNADGTIATTFTFNKGSFDGERKSYSPKGFVREGSNNAVWGMQFLWPFKAEYRVVYVDEAYEQTIIGRTKRDYVWIMSRDPQISEAEYQTLVQLLEEEGYDVSKIRRVPQRWEDVALASGA